MKLANSDRMTWTLKIVRILAVFALAVVVIAARRWPQFINPDVWAEDGKLVIPSFARHGWAGLLEPVQGYLVIPGKLISYISLSLSFSQYAFVSTILATAAQALVVTLIAFSPTLLAGQCLAALLVPILPSGSEVYALPFLTFWWTTLLLVTGLFWRDGERLESRLASIAIGGLSSPFVVAAWPIFALRAAVERTRGNFLALVLAIVMAVIQGWFMLREHTNRVSLLDAFHHMPELVSKYFGTALYSLNQHGAGPFGALVLAFLIAASLTLPRERRWVYLMLGLCLGVGIVTSVSRVPVSAPHPLLAAPRYFFFPLVFTGWMLIMLVCEAPRIIGLIAMAIFGAYVPSFAVAFTFEPQVAKKPWSDQVAACVAAPEIYTFDIQSGVPQIAWTSTMSGDDCRKLENAALLDASSSTAYGK